MRIFQVLLFVGASCSSLLFSGGALSAACEVAIKNEVHLSHEHVEIVEDGQAQVVMNNRNELYIHGEKIELESDQEKAIAAYRDKVNEYLPKAKAIANESLVLADGVIDDISESLDMPEAFESTKVAMKEFLAEMESKYYQDGDLVMPAVDMEQMMSQWQQDFDDAMEVFNEEFFESAFNAMSEKMDQEGGLNLSALADSMAEIKTKLEARLSEHEHELEKQSKSLCDSFDGMAEEEKSLHEKIPQLKDYQVFTI